jgi:hypothetical protein
MRSWLIIEEIFKVCSLSIQYKSHIDGSDVCPYELIETILNHHQTLQLFQICLAR